VAAARAVLDALRLDRLLLVVANDPWQKSPGRAVSPAEDRFALTRAMAEEVPGAEASRVEIDRGGPSYSVDTVEQILGQAAAVGRPAPEIYLVVGADLVAEMETWERARDLRRLVTLVVVSRPTAREPVALPGWRVEWVHGPQVDVSSSAVREILTRGGAVGDLVPAGVVRCIRRRALYAVDR